MPYTFRQLVAQGITIPDIQRDYAQGRLTPRATAVREGFVPQLIQWLADGKPHQLDFVYGYRDAAGRFIPLDGQQRLTTLLLLHLILEARDGHTQAYAFTYETRDSSTRFVDALIQHADILKEGKPSEAVRDAAWYYCTWDADPTVSGMLVMLDAIHHQLLGRDIKALHNNLDNITFYFHNLGTYHAPDDLFIKMNARGLALTDYELMKSRLEEDYRLEAAHLYVSLAQKIDTTWSDTLWHIERKRLSQQWERLLRALIGLYALPDAGDKQRLRLMQKDGCTLPFVYARYKAEGVQFSRALLVPLYEALDVLLNTAQPHRVVRDIVNAADPSYELLLTLYAHVQYARRFSAHAPHIGQWKRVVHNLLAARNIDKVRDLVRAMRAIDEAISALNAAGDPLEYLVQGDAIAAFDQLQVEEERRKARLIKADPAWLQPIREAEEDEYMDGQIDYLLDYAHDDIPAFRRYTQQAKALWAVRDDIVNDYSLVRAMLSKGNYMDQRPCTCNSVGHRDYSWRRLLHIPEGRTARFCLKQIFDSSLFAPAHLDRMAARPTRASFKGCEWQRWLCTQEAEVILRRSDERYTVFSCNDGSVMLLYRTNRNSTQWEVHLLHLAATLGNLNVDGARTWEHSVLRAPIDTHISLQRTLHIEYYGNQYHCRVTDNETEADLSHLYAPLPTTEADVTAFIGAHK